MSATLKHTNQGINDLSEQEARWFAIYTKYKAEKYVADKLDKKGITCYVPLITKTKRYTRKVKTYDVPLINCYAFVYIKKEQYQKVLETEYVLHFVKQRRDLIAIPEGEIQLLQRIVGEQIELTLADKPLKLGQKVEFISGNLTGIQGYIEEQHGKQEFVVVLDNLGFQLRINVDHRLLRPVV